MKTSLTMTFPAPLPVLRVRVVETAPANRASFARAAFGLFVLASLATCVGTLAWLNRTEIRLLAARPHLTAPVPALTMDQWMTSFGRR